MAKDKDKPKPSDIEPAEGFADLRPDPLPPELHGPLLHEMAAGATDPRDDELARLRAENAALKAAKAPAVFAASRYRVSLHDGPTAVVECEPGEHPFEAYKRVTGVTSSQHAPVINAAAETEPAGIVRA